MRPPQLELWSAEPHPTPPIYQHLTPSERSRLITHLAQLILQMVVPAVPSNPPPSTPTQNHER